MNRYTIVPGNNSNNESFGKSFGNSISFPLVTRSFSDVHPSMRGYIVLSVLVFVVTVAIFVTIIINAVLPPGFVDPNTHAVRFVSDGFSDYPACSWACLVFLVILVVCFTFFAIEATIHSKPQDVHTSAPYFTGFAGTMSIVGFSLVVAYPVGTSTELHISGAVMFITFYTVMQIWLDVIMWSVHEVNFWSRMLEYGILAVNVVSFMLFALLMVISSILGGDHGMTSGSAIAEYVVFASFVGLNLYGMSRMTYIASWYRNNNENEWEKVK
jgi:hypothetical protein